jgi:hypothetical protein
MAIHTVPKKIVENDMLIGFKRRLFLVFVNQPVAKECIV